jgi:ketosteroid isomerase-like protein
LGPGNDAQARSLSLVQAVFDAFDRSDWATLRDLYHEDARLRTVAAHGRIVGPDELMSVFEGLEQTAYHIGEATIEAIDDDAVVVSAHLRYPLEQSGIGYASKSWLLTFKDGLVYRTDAYGSMEKARLAYRQHGVELGIPGGDRS